MIRQIIKIDEDKCNGCGACESACHEGAIEVIGGKAKLTRENYCDGLGDCLPACPTNAISFEEREAPAYDETAVSASKNMTAGCPGSRMKEIKKAQLMQWPVQIKLVPVNAQYFNGADLLIAADCSAYAYGDFHNKFIRNRITLIGCPKLDEGDYTGKLAEIFINNDINSVTVVRMEVPCCGGIEFAAKKALEISGKAIPCDVVTISTEGEILE